MNQISLAGIKVVIVVVLLKASEVKLITCDHSDLREVFMIVTLFKLSSKISIYAETRGCTIGYQIEDLLVIETVHKVDIINLVNV